MRKFFFLLVLGLVVPVTDAWASIPKEWPFETITVNGMTIYVEFLDDGIIHVQKYPEGQLPRKEGGSVVMKGTDPWVWKHFNDSIVGIATSTVSLTVDKRTGCVTFGNSSNGVMLTETMHALGDGVMQQWALLPDEAIFVKGQLQSSTTSIPFVTSERGYGLYWNFAGSSQFKSGAAIASFSSGAGQCIDYYFLYTNGTQDGVIAALRQLLGQATLFSWIGDIQSTLDEMKKQMSGGLNCRLHPYLYSTAGELVLHDKMMIRPLVMDFPKDKRAFSLRDEYMCGSSLLVKSVSESAGIYLPAGTTPDLRSKGWRSPGVPTKWYDFITNKLYDGGQQIESNMPLYVRAGSILPFGPEAQDAMGKCLDSLELRIYTGADGQFTLYENEGDNYDFVKGTFSEISFYWDDVKRELLISGRTGKFKGMLKKRQFRIVLVNENSSAGNQPISGGKIVKYKGKKLTLKY